MTITRVAAQAGGATVDLSTTASRAFPSNVTAGNLVWIAAGKYDPNSPSTFVVGDCTKSAGTATIGAITLDCVLNVGSIAVGIWSALVTGSGSLTLQVSNAATVYSAIGSDEWASSIGWDASRREDFKTGSGTATTQATASMTSAGAAGFVGVTCLDASGNISDYSQTGAYTRVYLETDGSVHEPGCIFSALVGTGTSQVASTSNSLNGSQLYVAAGVVYKEATGGAAPQLEDTLHRSAMMAILAM